MWFSLLLTVFVALVSRAAWRRLRYDVHKIPSLPEKWFFGHASDFVFGDAGKRMSHWLQNYHEKLGCPNLFKVRLFSKTVIFVADERIYKEVLVNKPQMYKKRVLNRNLFDNFVGGGPDVKYMLLDPSVTPYVKAVRKIYASAFQSSELKKAMPRFNSILHKLMEKIDSTNDEGYFDCQELFSRMTLDVIGEIAFDTNLGGLDKSRWLYQLLIDVGHIGRRKSFNPFTPIIARLFPQSQFGKDLERIRLLTSEWDWLTGHIMAMEDPDNGEEPIWFGLTHLVDPETKKSLTYYSLRAEVATVVLGGMDTTGHQLGWMFALLATHPHVVERLIDEMKEHGLFGDNARDATFEDLADLEYLAAIVKESMRLAHIMVMSLSRETTENMILSGFRIPKGTYITMLGNRAVNKAADWGDSEVFRPDRWLTEKDLSNNYSLGFLKGPRDCIGKRLAMLEMRLTVLELCKCYEFTLKGTYEDLIKSSVAGLAIEASEGIWLRASKPSTAFSFSHNRFLETSLKANMLRHPCPTYIRL